MLFMEGSFSHQSTFPTLESLKKPVSLADMRALSSRIETHFQLLDEESLSFPHINYGLARTVAEILNELIADLNSFDSDQRQWLFAAGTYFVLEEDGNSDLEQDGLLDDAEAVSFVCRKLGREDLAARLVH